MFEDWLDKQDRFNTRIELGVKTWRKVFTKPFLLELRDDLLLLLMVILTSPFWIPTYLLGRYVEWRDDRVRNIKNVKP